MVVSRGPEVGMVDTPLHIPPKPTSPKPTLNFI